MQLASVFQKRLMVNASSEFRINTFHHVAFWLIYFTFNFLRWGSYYHDYYYSLKSNLLGFPIHITLTYFTIYFLIPRFILKRKLLLFVLILFSSIFIMVVVKYLLTHFLISYDVWPEGPETYNLTFNYTIVMMLGELYVITFVASIKLTIDYLRESRRAARLEKEQLETELRFLRGQVSPHFFFNTLNNIYSLSLMKSEKTPDTIIKLSDLMRYMLYDTKDNDQYLEKELDFVKNYIDLERIRYNDQLQLDFRIEGNPEGKKIAPLLLIQFIENAFKHGANKSIGRIKISIYLKIDEKFLYFTISNTKPESKKEIVKDAPQSGGIGLSNVEKRLKLRYSEKEYRLEIHDQPKEYKVKLKLQLR